MLYLWSLQTAGAYGYVPCLMFAVCMALRLARFNAALDSAPHPAYAYNFFTGVPAPAGAGAGAVPAVPRAWSAKSLGSGLAARDRAVPAVHRRVLIGTALLLVSTLPVWSFKNFKVPTAYVLPLLLGTGAYAAVLVADPWAGARRRRVDLSRHAAVQRPQLPSPAAGGRGTA